MKMRNHPGLKADLNEALDNVSLAKKKPDIINYLRRARTYAGALDHPQLEAIGEKIEELEKIKGRIVSEDLRKLKVFCKSLKV